MRHRTNNIKFEYDLTQTKTYLTLLNSVITTKEDLTLINPDYTEWLVNFFKTKIESIPYQKLPFYHPSLSVNFKELYNKISTKDLSTLPQLSFLLNKSIYEIPRMNAKEFKDLINLNRGFNKEPLKSFMVYPLDLETSDTKLIKDYNNSQEAKFFDFLLHKPKSRKDTEYECNINLSLYRKSYEVKLRRSPKDVHYFGYINTNDEPVILNYVSKKEFKEKNISQSFLQRVRIQENYLSKNKIKNKLKGYLVQEYKELYLLKTPLGFKTKVFLVIGVGNLEDDFFQAKLLIKD